MDSRPSGLKCKEELEEIASDIHSFAANMRRDSIDQRDPSIKVYADAILQFSERIYALLQANEMSGSTNHLPEYYGP